ncbi:hypothetical protein QOZ80_7AG0553690 [Eleusine coracana subsp. coracana]|nr:hypothetical protein QOZ80_7AG0553690 [Eleusine coracana subsp. coracana]
MAALMDDLVDEVLLRIPPDEPASLVRAALVCKRWRSIVTEPGFRRRFRQFHGTPPLLGVLCHMTSYPYFNDGHDFDPLPTTHFVPTFSLSFCPTHASHYRWRHGDVRHGRILLYGVPWRVDYHMNNIVVWDPITDDWQELPKLPTMRMNYTCNWNIAIACAAGDRCDHLDCHRGPFLVIFMGINYQEIFTYVYSSESNVWSERISSERRYRWTFTEQLPAVLVGNSVYFLVHMNKGIVRFDLNLKQISAISLPCTLLNQRIMLMAMEDRRSLGYGTVSESKVFIWEVYCDLGDYSRLGPNRVIDLEKLMPASALEQTPVVNGFIDGLSRVLFIWTVDGFFTVDMKSEHVREISKCCAFDRVITYFSFYTPGTLNMSRP